MTDADVRAVRIYPTQCLYIYKDIDTSATSTSIFSIKAFNLRFKLKRFQINFI